MNSANKLPKRSRKNFDLLSNKQKRIRQQAHYNAIRSAVECTPSTSSNQSIIKDCAISVLSSKCDSETINANDNNFHEETDIDIGDIDTDINVSVD